MNDNDDVFEEEEETGPVVPLTLTSTRFGKHPMLVHNGYEYTREREENGTKLLKRSTMKLRSK